MRCYLLTVTCLDATVRRIATSDVDTALAMADSARRQGYATCLETTSSDRLPDMVDVPNFDWRLLQAIGDEYDVQGFGTN